MSAHTLIADRIRARGPLTMAEFMALALYHPQEGYYTRAAKRTGRQGDFVTSVDVGPTFGALLSRQFAEMWRALREVAPSVTEFDLVEAAAADGQLARDVLDTAAAEDPAFYAAIRLHLVEASPAARAGHATMLAAHTARLASSGPSLPKSVHGVVFANELLDALPVHAVAMTAQGLRERYIDLDGDRFVERLGEPSTPALARHLESLGVQPPVGWRGEVNLSALAWLTRVRASMHRGFLLLIDYGRPAAELYSEAHATGTLATYAGQVSEDHRAGTTPPWLTDPGARDITSLVDLTSIRAVAESLGCHTLGMVDQTYFLLGLTGDDAGGTSLADLKARLALKTLVMPGGLGSTMKVMLFGVGVGQPRLRGLSGPARLT